MPRQLSGAATAVCDEHTTTAVHQSGGAPATPSDAGGSEEEPDLLLLRTVQEGTVWSAGNGSNGCDRLHGLTPCPASFLVSEGNALRRPVSERFMKRDKDVPRLREDCGKLPSDGSGFLCGRPSSLSVGPPTTPTGGNFVEGGFPALVRRRTFAATATSSSVEERNDYSIRGGRVPMSMSEDNMLALLARHPPNSMSPPDTRHESAQEDISNKPSFPRPGQASSFSERAGGHSIGGAATRRARRNSVVMKLHRASLVEDASRCVMDIVQGRAAAAEGRQSLLSATLEEVKAHFRSLPRRYALSVDPADALTHMKLLKDAADPAASSRVQVVVHPRLPSVGLEEPGRSGGCASDRGNAGVRAVLVVCRYSPFLLGAISSALRSAEGTCLDADVMTTTNGIAVACIEVEGDWSAANNDHRGNGRDNGALPPEGHPPATTSPQRHHPLTNLLSCGIARALVAAAVGGGGGNHGEGQGQEKEEGQVSARGGDGGNDHCRLAGDCSVGSDASSEDLSAPFKKAKATDTDSAEYCSSAPASSLPMEVARPGDSPPPPPPPVPELGGLGDDAAIASISSSVAADPDADAGTSAAEGVTGRAGSLGRRRAKRVPLARREGRSCLLAETDAGGAYSGTGLVSANEFVNGTDAFRGGTGGGNGGGGDDSCVDGVKQQHPHDDDCIAPEEIELLELVGEGRFSRLHRARWRGSTVAVKTVELPADLPPQSENDMAKELLWKEGLTARSEGRRHLMTEFERELHVVRRLSHPNICEYRGACISEPHLSLVYEFLENGTLGDRLRNTIPPPRPVGVVCVVASDNNGCRSENGSGNGAGCASSSSSRPRQPLTYADLLRIVGEVAEGMRYLHEMGVLHRDLKPDNILLDGNDVARVADFGLSCFGNPSKEHTAETGTYRWMAPEVIRHEPYGQSADVYSYGVVLWEVLTRRQPFEGLTPIQAAFAVAHQGLRPRLPPGTPSSLASLIRRCWHQSPGTRPGFAQVCCALPDVKAQVVRKAWES